MIKFNAGAKEPAKLEKMVRQVQGRKTKHAKLKENEIEVLVFATTPNYRELHFKEEKLSFLKALESN